MNLAIVGHGMMGEWHSVAAKAAGAQLHTLVGRRPEPTAEFAAKHGYARWTLDLDEALADPAVDAIIFATPTEQHAANALRSIEAAKPTLLEIPIAMYLAEAEHIVERARAAGVMLAMVHPMRFRPERAPLRERIAAGEEHIHRIEGRFFIHRLVNVGATGYRRSWIDNLLWHHSCHLVDLGLWMLALEGSPIRRVYSHMPPIEPRTGIPMELTLSVETEADQVLSVTGSYYCAERLYDTLVVTDRDSYRIDILAATQTTRDGPRPILPEQDNCALVTRDFIDAVQGGREPHVPAASVLPAMRVLQQAQDQWDAVHGAQVLPGRPVPLV